ncbi:anti-sigma factor domain-containing protein [Cellulomonas sp. S1-8]|uniref:anti-sigma factor n=1 Tax=Cellulomonas sp. S1-8 TaxID=2904790 RepID=UPI002243A61F|nr:anti-sigma factor [Cellulomonas sp. S1-8]UZN02832.1 anti-sigma factor [Cellulomonas sp. S1-8]
MSAHDDRDAGQPDVRDLLGAYALDAVDDVERRAVERLVASDPDAARELAELRATAALLGSAVQTAPPADVRGAVLEAIRREPQDRAAHGDGRAVRIDDERATAAVPDTAGVVSGDPRRVTDLATRRRAPRPHWLAVAAIAVGAAAVPAGVAWQQAQEADRAREQAQVLAALLAEPGTEVVRGEVEGGGTAVGVLGTDRAVFTATGLDDPGAGREYQLWVIRDGVAVPDVVMPDASGEVRAVTDAFAPGDALAVTVEPSGGSQEPTTDVLVVLAAEV